MKSNFPQCMGHVFRWEGGFVDHPDDPGGRTKYGISQRAYPSLNIRKLTKSDAEAIYRRDYWDAVRGDDLPAGLDLVAFDAAVHSGVSRGAKWVQHAVGVTADGRINDRALDAARASDLGDVIDLAVTYRENFLRQLGHFRTFGRGWLRRTADTRSLALEMAKRKPAPKVGIVALIAALLGGFFIYRKGENMEKWKMVFVGFVALILIAGALSLIAG